MIGLLNVGSLMLGLIAWILPALGCLLFMLTKLFKKFDDITVKNKLILSIPAFIITVFFLGIILSSFDIQ
ncbi:hypothetical protein [Oceanobacillus sojae]|uniref:hypothetical protein n=1 Tax=Oceanobacillus sojae TaxID=582851 RepID=UPI0009887317|nr:hypothetical protein [Oceanobacillus sojae]MCT1905460.1 hypothetical protein [Oceanobacillus sojae]